MATQYYVAASWSHSCSPSAITSSIANRSFGRQGPGRRAIVMSANSQLGRVVNKEQTPSLQSKPNEGFQLHRPELLIAAANGDIDEVKRLLLLHTEVILDVEETDIEYTVTDIEDIVVDDVKKPAATAIHPSEAVTGAGDTVLHVVASSGDAAECLECATVIVRKANHLLHARNLKGDTPLHCAARLRNARMVSHLLARARAGASTRDDERVKAILRMRNLKGETVLHEAVRLEDKDMIRVLLSADSQLARVPLTDGASPLYLALSLGHRNIALLLIEKDEELSYSGPDGQNALHAAIRGKLGEEIIKMLLERNKDLIKQADRCTGWTPLHMAALFGERRVTELLLSADPSPSYLTDNDGLFPIHLAASNGQSHNVSALLQKKKSDSSKEQDNRVAQLGDGKDGRWLSRFGMSVPGDSSKEKNGITYCAQLRDGKGRTFLHVAAEKKRFAVVKYACQEQGKMFASSVMNMQDDRGNTALHLAVEVGDISIVQALVSIPEVKLNLTNNTRETPLKIASRYRLQEANRRYLNPRSRVYWVLHDAAVFSVPRMQLQEDILLGEIHNDVDGVDRSQTIIQRTQVIALGSVLITTVTFAAAFALPGGYRADGTPTLAGQYAFNAFVMANTLAFIFAGLSTTFLMFAGLGSESGSRVVFSANSENFLACSARSLVAAFLFGMYAVLAPVEHKRVFIPSCVVMVGAVMALEVRWGLWAVKAVFDDTMVVVKRFGCRAWLDLAGSVLGFLSFAIAPYILISMSGLI